MDHIQYLIELLSDKVQLYFSLMYHPEKRGVVQLAYERLLRLRRTHFFHMEVVMLRPVKKEEQDRYLLDPRYTEEDFRWQKKANQKIAEVDNVLPFRGHKCNSIRECNWFYDFMANGERKIVHGDNIEETPVFCSKNQPPQLQGMYCLAGSHLLRIESDGRCSGIVCRADKAKGNIFENNPYMDEEFIHTVQCPLISCGCIANRHVPKFSDKVEAEIYASIFREKQKRLMETLTSKSCS